MDQGLIRSGFILILLGLLTGPIIPQLTNPRLGLAAHTVAIVGGILLIAVGAIAAQLALPRLQRRVMNGCWLYASYVNWLACLIGGATGASRLTPIAGAGTVGTPLTEGLVQFLLLSLSLAALVATGLAIRGLSGARSAE